MWLLYSGIIVYLIFLQKAAGVASNSSPPPKHSTDIHETPKPHIIIILADDLGWNDVSFHGTNEIPTPNIDALAYNGVILNDHYVCALCTPSRAALMTGKYPIHTGMQHRLLIHEEPRGLPLKEKLLPQFMKDAGYITHAVGKWHLGFYKKEYTPTYRGFDTHFGYWGGYIDYYSHEYILEYYGIGGMDMRRNMSVSWDTRGKYATDLFTEETVKIIEKHDTNTPMFMYLSHLASHAGNNNKPYQAPDEEIAKFSYINDTNLRTYAAMVSKLDASVGEVMKALHRQGMLNNSIIIFMSDNGAPTTGPGNNLGNNYPFRGIKGSSWEGAVRGVAAVWSPLIKKPRRVSNQLMHISDWLPTLYSAAGMNVSDLGTIDGINMWNAIVSGTRNPRSEVLINIDEISKYSVIRRGDWKYVTGNDSPYTDWYGHSGKVTNFSADDYVTKIFSSEAAIAINKVISEKQARRRNEKNKKVGSNETTVDEYDIKTLDGNDVKRLRSRATINCNVTKEQMVACDPLTAPCLFNVRKDPCEYVNLAKNESKLMASLKGALATYGNTSLPANNVPLDPLANPLFYENVWVNWKDSDVRPNYLLNGHYTENNTEVFQHSPKMQCRDIKRCINTCLRAIEE